MSDVKNMADWSDLPPVYVTKAELVDGIFWQIEACSVPMAIGPEVQLIRADVADARAESDAAVALALEGAINAVPQDPPYGKSDGDMMRGREIGYKDAAYDARSAIRALIPASGTAELERIRRGAFKLRPDGAKILAKEMQAIVAADRWKGRDLNATPPEKWSHLRPETQQFWVDTAARILALIQRDEVQE